MENYTEQRAVVLYEMGFTDAEIDVIERVAREQGMHATYLARNIHVHNPADYASVTAAAKRLKAASTGRLFG